MGAYKDREKLPSGRDSNTRPSDWDHRCFTGCATRPKREEQVEGIRDLIPGFGSNN